MEKKSNLILSKDARHKNLLIIFDHPRHLIINISNYNNTLSSVIRYGGLKNINNGGEMK